MPSFSTASEIIKSLTELAMYRLVPAGGNQLTTANAAKEASTIVVAAATSFTELDPIIIKGDGGTELNEWTSVSTLTVTLGRKLAIAQSAGARVREAVKVALGHIAEDSARAGGTSSSVPIPAATSRTPIGFLQSGGELNFGFGLLGIDGRSLALAFGQDELETGTGTAIDPYQNVISQDTVGQHGLLCFRGKALRTDGMIIEFDFNDVTIDAAADINFSGKQPRPIAVGGKCTSHIIRGYFV